MAFLTVADEELFFLLSEGRFPRPTLIITGDADVLTPVKYAQFLKDNIPGAQMAVIPGAGHMVAREKPAEFIPTVIPFLDSIG
jgi:pimeloyl-ACP methyl ester carboxylesterase